MPFFMNPFKKHDPKDLDVFVDLANAERHPSAGKARNRSLANSAEDKPDNDVEPARASDTLSGYTVETLRAEIDLGM